MRKETNRGHKVHPEITRREKIGWVVYIVFLIQLVGKFTVLFYRQSLRWNGEYRSDTAYYVNNAVENPRVSFRWVKTVFSFLYEWTESRLSIALFMALSVGILIVSIYFLLKYLMERVGINANRNVLKVCSALPIFLVSVSIPGVYVKFYAGALKSFAWHSPTQHQMLVFAVLSFTLFLRIYDRYLKEIKPVHWAVLSFLLFLSAYAKPSFIMCLYPAVLIVFLGELIKKRQDCSRGYRLKRMILLGASTIPSMVYVSVLVFRSFFNNPETGIVLKEAAWSRLPLMIIFGLAFPLWILVFNRRKLWKDLPYRLVWIMFGVALAQVLTFQETGKRSGHGNFGWGLQCSVLFVFILSIQTYLSSCYDREFLQDDKRWKVAYHLVSLVLLFLHLLSGMVYFYYVYNGKTPYIF